MSVADSSPVFSCFGAGRNYCLPCLFVVVNNEVLRAIDLCNLIFTVFLLGYVRLIRKIISV